MPLAFENWWDRRVQRVLNDVVGIGRCGQIAGTVTTAIRRKFGSARPCSTRVSDRSPLSKSGLFSNRWPQSPRILIKTGAGATVSIDVTLAAPGNISLSLAPFAAFGESQAAMSSCSTYSCLLPHHSCSISSDSSYTSHHCSVSLSLAPLMAFGESQTVYPASFHPGAPDTVGSPFWENQRKLNQPWRINNNLHQEQRAG